MIHREVIYKYRGMTGVCSNNTVIIILQRSNRSSVRVVVRCNRWSCGWSASRGAMRVYVYTHDTVVYIYSLTSFVLIKIKYVNKYPTLFKYSFI